MLRRVEVHAIVAMNIMQLSEFTLSDAPGGVRPEQPYLANYCKASYYLAGSTCLLLPPCTSFFVTCTSFKRRDSCLTSSAKLCCKASLVARNPAPQPTFHESPEAPGIGSKLGAEQQLAKRTASSPCTLPKEGSKPGHHGCAVGCPETGSELNMSLCIDITGVQLAGQGINPGRACGHRISRVSKLISD